jgi:hypothetical protein
MFRLSKKFKEAIECKYDSSPIVHGGKNIPFSMDSLSESVGVFAKGMLFDLDEELFVIFNKRKKNPGYSQDSLLKVFITGTNQRDFIDLLFYYTHGVSYERAVIDGLANDDNDLNAFNQLRAKREGLLKNQPKSLANRITEIQTSFYNRKRDLLNQFMGKGKFVFEYEYFDINDIENLKKLPAKEIFGHEIHWDVIERCFEKNRAIIQGIKLLTPIGDELIAGFFILYPLTKECDELIRNGTIIKSDQLIPEYICDDFKSAFSIYISYVYGEEGSESAVLEKLKEELRILLSLHPQIIGAYVRPTTDDGRRVAKRHRFNPVEATQALLYNSSKELLKGKSIFRS